jgi:hypothetical protein
MTKVRRAVASGALLLMLAGGLARAEPSPRADAAGITVEWQQGERVWRLAVPADGRVLLDDEQVGVLQGRCITSVAGVPWSVCLERPSRVVGGDLCSGRFVVQPRLAGMNGRRPSVGEILLPVGRDGIAMASNGEIWVVPADRQSFSLPARVVGLTPRNRRVALALACIGPGLVGELRRKPVVVPDKAASTTKASDDCPSPARDRLPRHDEAR